MQDAETLGSYLRDNKDILKESVETRIEILRLSAIRTVSKSAGYLIWLLISLFVVFLIILFSGIVLGLWLSSLTGSYITGFALVTLFFVLIFALMAIFRQSWFVNPIIHGIIARSGEVFEDGDSANTQP